MLNPANVKRTAYADRPVTPLGEATGLTSTPVSEHPTRGNTPRPSQPPNPYHYQPAIVSARPELTAVHLTSSNYAKAQAESLSEITSSASPEDTSGGEVQIPVSSRPGVSRRSYSFSAEDLKRSKYQHLMKDDVEARKEGEDVDEQVKKDPLQSPGVGNSEMKGREFGFTSAE